MYSRHLGMYPLYPGRADMVLSSPVFSHVKLGNLTINAPKASDENRFIDHLTVNGVTSQQSWIDETYITKPVTLNFGLSAQPNKSFGKALEHRPPSYSSSVKEGGREYGTN